VEKKKLDIVQIVFLPHKNKIPYSVIFIHGTETGNGRARYGEEIGKRIANKKRNVKIG
jgi:hypothetical protein